MTYWGPVKEWFSFKGSVVKFRSTKNRAFTQCMNEVKQIGDRWNKNTFLLSRACTERSLPCLFSVLSSPPAIHLTALLKTIWQAKHDKSGLSWKSPIESQWSICEIEKSLCEIGKSLREITKSQHEKLKLLYENEKMSCEIIITNREWKTAMWDLY